MTTKQQQLDAEHVPEEGKAAGHGSLKSYSLGFVLSLALTGEAFLLVQGHTFAGFGLVALLLLLAVVQLLVQLFFFLHLDQSVRAPWNIIMFLFMAMVVSIVIFGSLWIMKNLDYHTRHPGMTPAQSEQYMKQGEGL